MSIRALVSRALLAAFMVSVASCNEEQIAGATCGGGQTAEAHAVLPDTGINSGDTVVVSFSQHGEGDLSELSVVHLWWYVRGPNPEANPRVRLVREDGLVLLDSSGSRVDQTGHGETPSWYVFTWIHEAKRRNDLFYGLRDEMLWLELRQPGSPTAGTRVRLETDRAEFRPAFHCSQPGANWQATAGSR
jgi:hypothetical protein